MNVSDVVIGGRYVFHNHETNLDKDNGKVVVVDKPDDYSIVEFRFDFQGHVEGLPKYTMLFDASELSEVVE